VFAPCCDSEFLSQDEMRKMYNWFENYRKSNYDIVRIADIDSNKETTSLWNDDAAVPTKIRRVMVLEKKTRKKSFQ